MSAYRDGIRETLRRRAELLEVARIVTPSLPELRSTYARRWGRIAAGGVGVALAAVWPFTFLSGQALPSYWLLGAVAGALGTYGAARLVAGRRAQRLFQPRPIPAPTGDDRADLARLDAACPLATRAAVLQRLELPSLALPLVAAALLGPLLLHFTVFALWCAATSTALAMGDFATWIGLSMAIVGHAHLGLAICVGLFAGKLARTETETLANTGWGRDAHVAIGLSTLVAACPGVVLLAVPPILAAFTAAVLVPTFYWLARRSVLADRRGLDAAREQVARVRIGVDDIARAEDGLLAAAPEAPAWEEPEHAPARAAAWP